MVGSEKVPFPSKPSSTGSGENNENDANQDKMMITKFQNNKKMVPKHFMSPTISAASKAAAPRKKVLYERNESSNDSDPEDNRRSYFDMKRSPNKNSSISPSNRSSSRIVVSSYDHHASESADDDYVDLSVKSYDPLRNYLSPRPKYLRFNPNRRHEIFNRLEKQDLDSSSDSKDVSDEVESASSVEEVKISPCSSPPKENDVKTKTEEVEIVSDDDYEEEEEELQERGLCVGVLKLLFTLVACFLSTSYICSTNSLSPSPTQSATWRNLTDSCPMIKKQTLELIGLEMKDKGWLEVGCSYNNVDEVEIYDEENGETEESIEAGIIEDNVDNLERCDKEFVGIENVDGEDKIDEDAETEVVRAAEIEYETEIFEEMIAAKTDESMSLLGVAEVLEIPDQLEEFEISVKSIPEEKTPHEPAEDAVLELQDTLTDDKVDDVVVYDNEAEMEKMGWNISAVVGVFITSLILTLLGIIYHSKKARNASARKTEFVLKPHKFGAEKKVAPVQRKIEFSARPPPLTSHLMEEASKELDHRISAPTVELIGEIVVGQLSNLKISGKNNQMTESEIQPVSPVTQPSEPLEHSTNKSASFGSFTTERKIKKKEGRLSEAMIEVTPVRRSTRLRNRGAATSP